ncbi:SDH family Clp fold serine proteinase [Sandaracinus amylolyticus]|uniref:SDH family Clp fold serine proteinase n=1 Tax=Sandaracinus amylolyticus TaxID=927083 RepID=UPI001F2B4B1E|nr:hypothetical protein [Sandaracinus amylolyticus]UJR84287.1 Hypothetical protein I5071_63650 [Sandaracinus amylolyticus]
MGRKERKEIIGKIEAHRKSKLLCYVTGDRSPITAQIGDDAVRPIFDHLRAFKKVSTLDLFIYSRGGAIDVPWRIVNAIRAASDEWRILIPFRANSAATLLALGADAIVMGKQGELGPIDPTLNTKRVVPGQNAIVQDAVSVEDVMAFVKFIQERCGLSEQDAIATAAGKLIDRVDAVVLGSLYRTHSHIRDVARRTLLSRKQPPNDQVLTTIVQTLAEQVYAHGHAIGYEAATAIGLPVEQADDVLEPLMWALLEDYESELKIREPLDPVAAVGTKDAYDEDACIAVVESAASVHRHVGRIEIRAKRQMPPQMNVNVNLSLQAPTLPQGMAPQQAQQMLQQLLQQAQPALLQGAQQAVQDALAKQAPLIGVDAAWRGGHWTHEP